MNCCNRRDFFKQLTLGSAALAFIPSSIASGQQSLSAKGASFMKLKGILPVLFLNDCAQLIIHMGEFTKTNWALVSSIDVEDQPGDMLRIAPTMILSDETIFELLEQLKLGQYNKDSDMGPQHRYSLFLGWIIYSCFRDETVKFYGNLIEQGYDYEDIRICHDAFIFREISGNHDAGSNVTKDEMAKLFNVMMPRMITRLHTLIPDSKDGMQWVVEMTKWRRNNKALMDKYAAELVNPNQDHLYKFIHQPGFYDGSDGIIQIARKLQNGIYVSGEEISSKLTSDPGESLYAKALLKGINKGELTYQYFTDNIEFEDFLQQINEVSSSLLDVLKQVNMKVYPNPVGGYFKINMDSEMSRVEIVNTLGQIVKSLNVKAREVLVNANDLEKGIYFVRCFDKNTLISTVKIIK